MDELGGPPTTMAVTMMLKTPLGTSWIESAEEFCTRSAPLVLSM